MTKDFRKTLAHKPVNNSSRTRSVDGIRTPALSPVPILSERKPIVISRMPTSLWAIGITLIIAMVATNKKQCVIEIS